MKDPPCGQQGCCPPSGGCCSPHRRNGNLLLPAGLKEMQNGAKITGSLESFSLPHGHLRAPRMEEPEGSSLNPSRKMSTPNCDYLKNLFFSYLEKLPGNVPNTVVEGSLSSALAIPAESPYLPPALQLSLDTARVGYKQKGFWSCGPIGEAGLAL